MTRERDLLDRPVVRVEFVLADGSMLARDWSIKDAGDAPKLARPPAWIENPRRSWSHPQDPVTLTGRVKAGHEDDARALLGISDSPNPLPGEEPRDA